MISSPEADEFRRITQPDIWYLLNEQVLVVMNRQSYLRADINKSFIIFDYLLCKFVPVHEAGQFLSVTPSFSIM